MPLNFDKANLDDLADAPLRGVMAEATKVNPDQQAKNNKLSRDSGVPQFAVDDNPGEVESRLNFDKMDLDTLQDRAPGTASWLSVPANAKVSHDDVGILSALEKGYNKIIPGPMTQNIVDASVQAADLARSLPSGFISLTGGTFSGLAEINDIATRSLARGVRAILPDSMDKYTREGTFTLIDEIGGFVNPSTPLRAEGDYLKELAKAVGVPKDRQNIATDIAGGAGGIAQQLAVAPLGTSMSLVNLMMQGVTQQADKQSATGTLGDSQTSDNALLMAGAVTAGLERIGLEKLVNRLPQQFKNQLTQQFVDIASAGGIEAVQETMEGIAQNLIEQYTTNKDAEIFKGLDHDAIVGGGTGAVVRAIANMFVPGRARSISDQQQIIDYQNTREQSQLDALGVAAENSKLRERDADSFAQFVKEMDGDAESNVYIDSLQTKLYLQTKTQEEIEADPALRALAEQVGEASRLDVDIVIPVGEFAGTIAGTEHFTELRESMTMSSETTSPFRAEKNQAETKSYIERVVIEAEDNASEYVEAQQIFDTVKEQLLDTGVYNAKSAGLMAEIVPAWATVYAKKNGMKVAEVFEMAGLTITGPQTGKRADLESQLSGKGYTQNEDQRLEAKKALRSAHIATGVADDVADTIINNAQATANSSGEPMRTWRSDTGTLGTVPYSAKSPFKNGVEVAVITPDLESQVGLNQAEVAEYQAAEAKGFEGYVKRGLVNEMAIFDPKNIRSVNAAFDPEYQESANILAQEGQNIGEFDPSNPDIYKQTDTSGARGYYEPANVTIRLNESADLSTFLHEFAHFMLEMERDANGDTKKSIDNWHLRNSAAVATEANQYFDTTSLEQRQIEDMFGDTVDSFGGVPNFKINTDYGRIEIKDMNNPSIIFTMAEHDGFNGPALEIMADAELVGGLGTSTKLYLEGLRLSQVQGLGFMSDSVMSSESHRMYERLSELGIPFETNEYGNNFITADDLKNVNIVGIQQSFNDDVRFAQTDVPEETAVTTIIAKHVRDYINNGTSGDKAIDKAVNIAIHEQFARGFEIYLMEGKAPSVELRNAFRSFARWMIDVWKKMRPSLKPNVDEEMVKVYDRLLATDEQIAAAESRGRYEPMFTDAAMAGMTEEQFISYQKSLEVVKDKQTETLRDKIIKQLARTHKKWWKAEKADLVVEETARLKTEKVYVARKHIKDEDFKLDLATVKEMVGVDKVDTLKRKSRRVPDALTGMTAPGGEGFSPDEAAGMFGYATGSELLADLMTAPSLEDAATDAAESRMLEIHGDIMTDGTIERLADEAVQNEDRGRVILKELQVLSKGSRVPSLDQQTIKAIAEQRIGALTYKGLMPAKYRKAEIKAAQESTKLLLKGDRDGAAEAKVRQVMNYYLGRAATDARNEIDKIVTHKARYTKKSVKLNIMKAGAEYWEQIDKILQRFEFKKSASIKSVEQKNTALRTWMENRIEEHGDALLISEATLNEMYTEHWKKIPLDVLRGIDESVRNIEHVALYTNKMDLLGEKVEFQKLTADWNSHMNMQPDVYKAQRTDTITDKPWYRSPMAQMTKVPFLASWLDGGERVGMSHSLLMDNLNVANKAEQDLYKKTGQIVADAILGRSKADQKRHARMITIPEIAAGDHNGNLRGDQIIAVALNTGNAGNLRKMLLGEGWVTDPKDSTAITRDNLQLQAVLKHMTASDWALVQLIWTQMETLYAPLAAVHQKTTGVKPPQVEATPFTVMGIEMTGGYYPAVYDRNRSARAAQNQDKMDAQVDSMFGGNMSIQASVTAGATNERTGYFAPIDLNLSVVTNHFSETIHFITHHDAIRQLNKLINDPSVTETIIKKVGADEYAMLKPWLNDIAKQGKSSPVKTYIDTVFGSLRTGVTLGVMGFKASTGIIQISGIFNTYAELGSKHTHRAMRTIYQGGLTSMNDANAFAVEHSNIMETRTQTMDREIKAAMDQLSSKRGAINTVQEVSMKHIALIQYWGADLISWHAGYTFELERSGDEAKAFKYADWVVENIQGSGNVKDMATIMRSQSKLHTTMTMFMTFFSAFWNTQRDTSRDLVGKGKRGQNRSVTGTAAKLGYLLVLPVIFEMLMRDEIDMDDEELWEKYLTKQVLYPIAAVPLVRDIASGVIGDFGYSASPVASMLESGLQGTKSLFIAAVSDKEITKSQVKNASKLAGAAIKLPGVSQAWATGEHLYDVISEGEEATLHQLLFGPKRD